MAGLLTAISTTWPGAADDALVLLQRAGAHTYDAGIAVANELAAAGAAGVIVIDDIHLAGPAPDLLLAFIDALPGDIRLVLGSRSDLPVSLARLRLRGGLLELSSADLRFSTTELAEFLHLQGASLLSAEEVDRLHDLTEGWPAGAQLAALALRRVVDHEQFFETFAQSDRGVGDFLLSEVLDTLPVDLVQFLVESSVLEEFDAQLCAAVAETEVAAAHLDRLIAANLFVVILDERAGWYRYHHLFGSFLRARLASLGEAKWRAIHDRASRALEARGDVSGALRHAMLTSDIHRAGQIMRAVVDRDLNLADGVDVGARALRLWLHEFGPVLVRTEPIAVVEFLIGLIAVAGPDDAAWWLNRVERLHPDADGELTALIEGAWSEHHLYRGRASEALRHARAGLDAVGGTPPARGLASLIFTILARAHLQAGELDEARLVLQRAAARPVGNVVADEVRNPGLAAWIAARDGELDRTEALVADVVRWADELELGAHEPGRIFAGLALAEVHMERNELGAAASALDDVRVAGDASGRPPFQSAIALQQARLSRALGDQAGAAALLERAEIFLLDPDAAARSAFAREAVHQALRFDPARAPDLMASFDVDDVETRSLRARLALLDCDHQEVVHLLEELPAAPSRRQRVECSVLMALAALDRDVEEAHAHLGEALVAGRSTGLIRCVIDQGEGVHKLLLSCAAPADAQRYLDELIAAAGNVVAPVRSSAPQDLVEPLSGREITVLRYLCSRLTYQEIANALYISLNTLKSHVRSIYRKLAVASRGQAVEAGRRLRLI